jgi:hypothetical protein
MIIDANEIFNQAGLSTDGKQENNLISNVKY